MRRLPAVAAMFVAIANAQSPLSFEVASVKPFQGLAANVYVNASGPKVTISEYGLLGLVMTAYKLEGWQIAGGPAWLESDRFNIAAKAPGDAYRESNRADAANLIGRSLQTESASRQTRATRLRDGRR
jgi:uncharacterized protein (TIGR03435 family)